MDRPVRALTGVVRPSGPERLRLRDSARYVWRVYAEQAGPLLAVAVVLFVPLGLLDALGGHGWELGPDEVTVGEVAGLMMGVVAQVTTATLREVFYAGVAMAAVTQSMEGRRHACSTGSCGAFRGALDRGGHPVLARPRGESGTAGAPGPDLLRALHPGRAAARGRATRGGRLVPPQPPARARHAIPLLALLGGLWVLTDGLTSLLQDGGAGALGETLLADWAIAVVTGVAFTPLWVMALCVATWQLLQAERNAGA